jgi:hypothetical protein
MEKSIRFQLPKLRFFCAGIFCILLIISPYLAACESSPEEKLEWCKTLANEASKKAFEAQATCQYPTANAAFNIAIEAAYIVAKVSSLAQDTADPQLAWAAYNVCNQVEAAIANVIKAARHIESHSTNPDEVLASKYLSEDCETAQKDNRASMEMALAPIKGIPTRAEAYSNR